MRIVDCAMDPYATYAALNARLAGGDMLYLGGDQNGLAIHESGGGSRRRLRYPRIGIYAGSGTSHSWLWFVDLFDRMGFYDVAFLDEDDVQTDGLADLDLLAVSGGDTFAVAAALGRTGAERIRAFVERGGVYIGSCAGAYLPMNSSKAPLHLFNFVDVKITNLSKHLPPAEQMPHKFCTSYGCDFIFHPVREAVRLKTSGMLPFAGTPTLSAPLYGGPAMIPGNRAEVLAVYSGFTDKTMFLVNGELASQTLLDHAAAVRVPAGNGCFYLFGPHFEHPRFPVANKLVADVIYWDLKENRHRPWTNNQDDEIIPEAVSKRLVRDLKRELSNSRIVAAGLEIMPIQWLIGAKIYEPEKIRVYLESMWSRIKSLETCSLTGVGAPAAERISRCAEESTVLLRRLKLQVDQRQESVNLAKELLDLLHQYATAFFDIYFKAAAEFRYAKAA